MDTDFLKPLIVAIFLVFVFMIGIIQLAIPNRICVENKAIEIFSIYGVELFERYQENSISCKYKGDY